MSNLIEVKELGCAGHLVVADRCRFRRHTQISDKYRISTVGDYFPDLKTGNRDTIGAGEDSFFETMVFETLPTQVLGNEGCGCYEVKEWLALECARYPTAGDAQSGHEKFIKKYVGLLEGRDDE